MTIRAVKRNYFSALIAFVDSHPTALFQVTCPSSEGVILRFNIGFWSSGKICGVVGAKSCMYIRHEFEPLNPRKWTELLQVLVQPLEF